jgi:hypothetical protein
MRAIASSASDAIIRRNTGPSRFEVDRILF